MYGLTLVVLCLAMFVAGLESSKKGVIPHTVKTAATVWVNVNLPNKLDDAIKQAKETHSIP